MACYNKWRFIAHVIASHSLFGIKTKDAVLLPLIQNGMFG